MKIRLLDKSCIGSETFYQDFLNGQIKDKEEYFTDEYVYIDQAPTFPIYLNISNEAERNRRFQEAFETISKYYLETDRDVHMNGVFWYTLLCTEHRAYILDQYPSVTESIKEFKNIVLKKFDWESYVYKCVLGAQYVNDYVQNIEARRKYYRLIAENLDLYNYIIKYEIFRNDRFLLNVLDIINDHEGLSKILKAKIKDRPDLGKDERYGRRVVFEFNKSYPIVMSPMMEKEELEKLFFEYLGYYYDVSKIGS